MSRQPHSLPFFWKMFAGIFLILAFVVGLVEVVLEPIVENMMGVEDDGFNDWHELVLWMVSILIPAAVGGYLLSKALSAKLATMTRASKLLALGDLGARLPVRGDDHDDFDILARSFNEMADAIETQLRNERRLLADISHELRSPLTRMSLAVELLKRRPGAGGDVLHRLEAEVEQMSDLVALLLAQARERERRTGEVETVDMGPLLEGLTADFVFEGKRHGKRLVLTRDEGIVVSGNPMLLRRMLGNLLSNALFYTPEEGAVEVTAFCMDDEVKISVRDFGPGVPKGQLESIFRAFYRVDDSRDRASGGVGLGLALAREAAVEHGGFITAENAGPGLRVTVSLPLFMPE